MQGTLPDYVGVPLCLSMFPNEILGLLSWGVRHRDADCPSYISLLRFEGDVKEIALTPLWLTQRVCVFPVFD